MAEKMNGLKNYKYLFIILLMILIISFFIFKSSIILSNFNNYKTEKLSNNINNVSNTSIQTYYYKSYIDEILNTNNYDSKKISITGKRIDSNNFDGIIIDEKGLRLPYIEKYPRGYNSNKIYSFIGYLDFSNNGIKYLNISEIPTESLDYAEYNNVKIEKNILEISKNKDDNKTLNLNKIKKTIKNFTSKIIVFSKETIDFSKKLIFSIKENVTVFNNIEFDSIKEISQNPKNFLNKRVIVKGELISRIGGYSLSSFDDYWVWIDDKTCKEKNRDYHSGNYYMVNGTIQIDKSPFLTRYYIKCDTPLE